MNVFLLLKLISVLKDKSAVPERTYFFSGAFLADAGGNLRSRTFRITP